MIDPIATLPPPDPPPPDPPVWSAPNSHLLFVALYLRIAPSLGVPEINTSIKSFNDEGIVGLSVRSL